ncbi:hypothetical protein ACXZ9C_11175 [Streptococcus agalactiae]
MASSVVRTRGVVAGEWRCVRYVAWRVAWRRRRVVASLSSGVWWRCVAWS